MLKKVKNIFLASLHKRGKKFGPELPATIVNEYNASRERLDTKYICHAPFSNMYFNVHGDCAPCWLTFIQPDSFKQKSIREIWFGEKYQTLRKHLLEYDLTHKCNVCLKNLKVGNYTSVLAKAYDVNPVQVYPTMMELEIENTCNLECVMCIGELSSAIRKNRDKLPAIKSPYNDDFIYQLEEFIPHLKELRFNGGEPFLIGSVFKIFEKVERLNPNLKIVVATNGTVWNYKVKEWLAKLNIHINFSLDSLDAETYETIRVNAHFDRVMEHFQHFHRYCLENKRTMCVMVNPMRNNWHEMPAFIRFVNEYNVNIWFNTIHRPIEWSIWAMPFPELEQVYLSLSHQKFEAADRKGSLSSYNIAIYNNLVEVQIKNWVDEAAKRKDIDGISSIEDGSKQNEVVAKDYFQQKMIDYLSQHIDAEKKSIIEPYIEKLNHIESLLNKRNEGVDFYSTIIDAPADVFYNETRDRSIESLVEDFEKRFLNKN